MMTREALLHAIASTMFYQVAPEDEPKAMELWERRLIVQVRQGKLTGYAVALEGYRRWLGHRQS